MANTASDCDNMFGAKLYQIRAQEAFPILVRQAECKQPLTYEDLASELDMPNARNLNFVLGSIGKTLDGLSSDQLFDDIPHIESLVINKHKGVPGAGFDDFLSRRTKDYKQLSPTQKKEYLGGYWNDIYAYPHWRAVLKACHLKPTLSSAEYAIEKAKSGAIGGGGEGPEHLRLKEYVAKTPSAVGLTNKTSGIIEYSLPSGDKVDVCFENSKKLVAVEIKSKISNDADIVRGLFQCVKYLAVIKAEKRHKGAQCSIESILVLGRKFPNDLLNLKHSLGINVIEILNYK